MDIDEIRLLLVKGDFEKFVTSAILLIESFSMRINELDNEQVFHYKSCMVAINDAIGNGDLLYLSDIVKFELSPLFIYKGGLANVLQ